MKAPQAPKYPLPTLRNGPWKVVTPAPGIHHRIRSPETYGMARSYTAFFKYISAVMIADNTSDPAPADRCNTALVLGGLGLMDVVMLHAIGRIDQSSTYIL